ncbi:MAG TPA: D-alanyl-D-alanine carboxypeptidase [Dehalococcoidia bacterium]|nr:D-alanyl-D-alanine carboxypeptidase [Dehalococcoidia bacterium]
MQVYDRRRNGAPAFAVVFGAVLIALAALQLLRPVPEARVTVTFPASAPLGEAKQPRLPEAGASIVAVDGLGTIGRAGPSAARPIASVTKIMTAYVVLKDHPLQPGQSGPLIEITQADVRRWQEMLAQDQSSLPVSAGQRLTQLQLLQGMLVPSANNFAEILAKWDAGSVEAFVQRMNAEAQALGMTNTRYVDTSGFSAETVSTPEDQLVLARAAMANPVFASIVATQSLQLPGIGLVSNVNQLLGVDGIVGIKTGFTEEAGGNLAFAARRDVGGRQVEIIGLVLGQPDRPAAFAATRTLLASVVEGLQFQAVVARGQPFATLKTAWGKEVELVVPEDVRLLVWPGMTLETRIEIEDVSAPKGAGEQVGWLEVRLGEQEARVPLTLDGALDGPGLLWKLTRF